jgi:hypothetical protein
MRHLSRASTFVAVLSTLAGTRPLAAQQDGLFRARVVELAGGAPVAGARVSFDRGQAVAVADSTGRFIIGGMPPGSHDVLVERIGYVTLRQRLRVTEGDSAEVVFRLTPDATVVGAVTATAAAVSVRMQAFEYRRTHPMGSARYLTRAELEKERSSTLADLLRRFPGARIVFDPKSNAANLASARALAPAAMMRTAPPCFAQIFIDGVQVFGASGDRRGSAPPNLNEIHADDLEAVEYYSSPASTPAEFRTTTSSCGTLVLWTREAH